MVLLAIVYLGIPPDLPQPPGWSPRPDHAAEVAQLYRSHFGLAGRLAFSADQLRLLNPLLLYAAALGYCVILWSRPNGFRARTLAALSAPLALASLLMPPLYATDIFFYAMSGEIVTRFGANPYVHTPSEFPTSAILPFNYWTEITSPYGPIWTATSSAAALASAADPFLCTLVLKAIALVAVAGTTAGIWKFLRATHPEAAGFGTMLFGLNPFVWLSAVGDGHVDMIMAALMVAAACLLARRHAVGAWCAISVATLTKYLTGPLLVVFLVSRVRQVWDLSGRLRVAITLCGVAVALAILAWAPYWAGLTTFGSLLEEGSRGYSAPPLLIVQALGDLLGIPWGVTDLAANIIASLMLATLAAWMLHALRTTAYDSVASEVRSWALTMTAIPALLPRSHPWYLLTAVALLAATYPRSRRVTLLVYAASGAWFLWRVGRV